MNDGSEFCPDYLDPVGIQAWKNITPKLWGKGLILPLDSEMLGLLCSIFSSYIKTMQEAKARKIDRPEEARILYEIATVVQVGIPKRVESDDMIIESIAVDIEVARTSLTETNHIARLQDIFHGRTASEAIHSRLVADLMRRGDRIMEAKPVLPG